MDRNLVIQTPAGGQEFDESQVPLYYTRKTADILHKYGPGPRVHFHMGLFAPGATPNTTVSQRALKRRIVESQETIVEHAARSWGAYSTPPGSVLDIGCGVGGGSLYWAQQHGATVTGLTVAADHIPVIEDFARQAGVGDRVTPSWPTCTPSRPTGSTTPRTPTRAPATWTASGSSRSWPGP